ncbi:MAG: hypothetical protein JXB85_02845 [Anaerolineales bacterium]|nr:hypothetical protein [Anaerolineales bacterium]
MGKYAKYQSKVKERPEPVPPIWRGIGCLLIILVPIMAWLIGVVVLEAALNNSWPLPRVLLGRVQFPDWIWSIPVLDVVAAWIRGINHLYAKLLFFVIALVLFSALFSTVYSIIFSAISPPRYSATDAPPPRRKAKSYKR